MDAKHAHYVAVTAIVVNKEGKFLIAKRAGDEEEFESLWTVPGGKLEMDDYHKTPKDTDIQWYNLVEKVAIREVKEEVGLDIKNIKYLTSLSFIKKDGVPTLVLSMFADHAGGEVVLDKNELTEHAWVDVKEAKNYNLIPGIYEELVMLDKILKGEKVDQWEKLDK